MSINAHASRAIVHTDQARRNVHYCIMNKPREDVIAYLRRVMEVTGSDLTGIARKAGLAASTLTRFYNGERVKHVPSLTSVRKIEAATNVRFEPSRRDDQTLMTRRFKAALWAVWGQNEDDAAEELGVSAAILKAIESGHAAPGPSLLEEFHRLGGFPPAWFQEGRWEGIPSPVAGRAGAYDPDLIPSHIRIQDDGVLEERAKGEKKKTSSKAS